MVGPDRRDVGARPHVRAGAEVHADVVEDVIGLVHEAGVHEVAEQRREVRVRNQVLLVLGLERLGALAEEAHLLEV